MRPHKEFTESLLYPVASIAFVTALWELVVRALGVPEFVLPAPSSILAEGLSDWQLYLEHTYYTLFEVAVGFALSLATGVPIAMLIVYSRILQNTIYPILVILQSVPKVALAPLIMLWFFRTHPDLPVVIITYLISFFPIVVDTATGLMTVSPELMDLARSLKAPPSRIFLKVRLPNAMPHLFAGVKVAITLAVVGAVVGEFVGGNKGLGYLILFASSQLLTKSVFVSLALLSIMGIALFGLMSWLEKLLVPWAYYRED